jgi:hypothetical protein
MTVLADDDVVVHGNPGGVAIWTIARVMWISAAMASDRRGVVVHNDRSFHNRLISLDLSEGVRHWGREVGHVTGADS